MAASKRRQDEKHLKILRELGALPCNKQCFDCHQRGPTYVNMTIGSFVCTSCSGILRGLNPPHRVKSISMASFGIDEIDFIRYRGNELCEREWMGSYDGQPPIESETKDDQRIKDFMITKYERKRWYTDPSTFRHQPMSTPQLTSSHPPPVVNNNKQNALTNNITINRPVMQSASFPPLNTLGKPSMDLLGSSGNNANASFANFDNFTTAPTSVDSNSQELPPLTIATTEAASADDVPIIEKSFINIYHTQKRLLGLSFLSSFKLKNVSRLPVINSKQNSKLIPGVNIEVNPNNKNLSFSTSSFLGSSNSSNVGTHPTATNILADSAFGGAAPTTSTNSPFPATVLPRPVVVSASSPAPLQQLNQSQGMDRYAALADLDSLFNSSVSSNASSGSGSANATVEWDGTKTNSNTWGYPFTSGGFQTQPNSTTNKEFDNVKTPSNPFTGMSFNSPNGTGSWNQKSNVALAPSPGNPFASSILNQPNHVNSSTSDAFGIFSNQGESMNNFSPSPANMAWGNSSVAVPTPFLTAATNGNYSGYKAAMQPQFGLWQPSIGNPFAATVVSAPQKSNSSNPFL